MKPLRLLGLLGLILAATLVTAIAWLLLTPEGARWSLDQAQQRLPALHIEGVDGHWLSGLELQRVEWRDDTVEVELQNLKFQWQPSALLSGSIDIHRLRISHARVYLLQGETDIVEDDSPLQLPALSLPAVLQLRRVKLDHLELLTGPDRATADTQTLRDLRFAGHWWHHNLRIHQLQLRHALGEASLEGRVSLRDDYPLRARLEARLADPVAALSPEPPQLSLETRGNLRELTFNGHLGPEPALRFEGQAALLDSKLPFMASIHLDERYQGPLPEGSHVSLLELAIEGNLERIRGSTRIQLDTTWLDAHLDADCSLQTGSTDWDCSGHLASSAPKEPLPPLDGPISLAWRAAGNLAQGPLVEADLTEVRGRVAGHPVEGALTLGTDDGSLWTLRTLKLAAGENRLHAHGQLGADNDLHLTLDLPALSELAPVTSGAARLALHLHGPGDRANATGQLQLENLGHETFTLADAALDFDIRGLGRESSRIQARINQLQAQEIPALSGTLAAEGDLESMRLRSAWRANDIASLDLGCKLSHRAPRWQLQCPTLDGAWLRSPGIEAGLSRPLTLDWDPSTQQLDLQPFCIQADPAQACLEQSLRVVQGTPGPATVSVRDLPLAWWRDLLPPGLTLDDRSLLNASLRLRSLEPMSLQLQAEVPLLAATLHMDEDSRELVYRDVSLRGEWQDDSLQLHLDADSDGLGQLTAQLQITDPRSERLLQGEARISQLQLEAISWAAPDLERLQGLLDGRVNLSGDLARPVIEGEITLGEGVLIAPLLRDPISPLQARLQFTGERGELQAEYQSGPGQGTLSGTLDWSQGGEDWRGRLALRAGKLALQPLPDSVLSISPDLELNLRPGHLELSGRVDVDEADLQINELPPGTANVSSDARMIGEEEQEAAWRIRASTRVDLGPAFRFRGFGADAWLAGQIDVHHDSAGLTGGEGEVTITRGRYRAYGQRLVVRRGSFVFSGPLDNPDLDLEAIRELPPGSDIEAGLQVSGSLQNPRAQLFSRPAMPESHIAYVLMTGRAPSGWEGENLSAGSALLSLGLAGGEGQAAELAERFGISDFQIATLTDADGSEAQLSGYLSPRLYVRYGVGMGERANSLTLQYRLTRRLLVEAVSGIDSALDLVYSFERR